VDLFPGAESGPQRESSGDSTESQHSGECAQPRSHAGSDMNGGTAPAVKHHRQKSGSEHAQRGRLADGDHENRYQQGNHSGGQSLAPFNNGRLRRGIGWGLFDCDFGRCSRGRERFGSCDSNLGGVTSGAERSAVLDACATLITRMFHSVSSYSRDVRGARKDGSLQCCGRARTPVAPLGRLVRFRLVFHACANRPGRKSILRLFRRARQRRYADCLPYPP
jgi:hypothetical protein